MFCVSCGFLLSEDRSYFVSIFLEKGEELLQVHQSPSDCPSVQHGTSPGCCSPMFRLFMHLRSHLDLMEEEGGPGALPLGPSIWLGLTLVRICPVS